MKLLNLIGKRFGKLSVLWREQTIGGKRRGRWLCLCDCGKTSTVDTNRLTTGTTGSCGCSQGRFIEYGLAAKRTVFSAYEKAAKNRGLPFELDFETFLSIAAKHCVYCGSYPSYSARKRASNDLNGNWYYNGIDRVDNAIGYLEGNCVACCGVCNLMKRTMPHNEFIEHIEQIASYQKHLNEHQN